MMTRAMASFAPACALMLLLAAANALPARERYAWMADGEGNLHLVDLLEVDPNAKAVSCSSDITLNLYTKGYTSSPEKIKVGDKSSSPSFNARNPTRFVAHGWTSNAGTMTDFARAYGAAGSYNVVLVDWSGPASPAYATAIANSKQVAVCLQSVINDLVKNRGLSLDDLYLIGHSLGGQMMGRLGYLLGGKVAQVVGLDPAGPSFSTNNLADRLDPSDGKVVQVIHTNGGGLGYLNSCGNIDFFPNDGSKQAGCVIDIGGSCSHGRAPTYYVESITSNKFVSRKCDSYANYSSGKCASNTRNYMGEHATGTAAGNYYLNTNTRSPFAEG